MVYIFFLNWGLSNHVTYVLSAKIYFLKGLIKDYRKTSVFKMFLKRGKYSILRTNYYRKINIFQFLKNGIKIS